MLIVQIHQLAGRVFARKLKRYGISELNPAQGRILFALWSSDGISVSELAERTLLEKSTLTTMLDRLEAGGFVHRLPSTEDRRKVLVCRTGKDMAFQKVYLEVSEEMAGLFYSGFSAREIDDFEDKLLRLLKNLRQSEG